MPFNNIAAYTAGQLISADDLNRLRENVQYLFDERGLSTQRVDEANNYSTSSTSFVDMDSVDLAKSVTINSGRALIIFACSFSETGGTGGSHLYLDIAIDGVRQGNDDGLTVQTVRSGTIAFNNAFCFYVAEGLAPGTHTFKVMYKTGGGGTITVFAGAGTPTADVHPFFAVLEI